MHACTRAKWSPKKLLGPGQQDISYIAVHNISLPIKVHIVIQCECEGFISTKGKWQPIMFID